MIDSPLALLLLVAAIVAVPLLLRRYRSVTPDGVRVVARTALSKGVVVAVLAVGDRRLLVGAGERGVQLLAELEPDPSGAAGLSGHVTTTTDLDGTDAVDNTPGWPDRATALAALTGTSQPRPTGPRIGLVDRLRAMTVRTEASRPRDVLVNGRTIRVPLRR